MWRLKEQGMQNKYSFGHRLSSVEEPIGPAYDVYRVFMKELARCSHQGVVVDADGRLKAIREAVEHTRKTLLGEVIFRVDNVMDLDTNQLNSTLVYDDVAFPLNIIWSLPNEPTAFGSRQIRVASSKYAGAWAHLETRAIIANASLVDRVTDGPYLIELPAYRSDPEFLLCLNNIPNLTVRKDDQLALLADYANGKLTNYRLVINTIGKRPTVLSFEKE